MKNLNLRKFKAFSLMLVVIVLSTFGCKKDNEMVTKPIPLTIKDSTQIYVFEGKEYTVKMVKEGDAYIPVENEITKMIDAAMEKPTSSTFVDLGTSKVYFFSTSVEADKFIEKKRNANPSKKRLKSGDAVTTVSWFKNADHDISSYVNVTDLSWIFVSIYNTGFYDNLNLSNYNCNDQISSFYFYASLDYDVYVTLCEDAGGYTGTTGHRITFMAPKGPQSNSVYVTNLNNYVMAKKLFKTITWNDQASSVYYGLG